MRIAAHIAASNGNNLMAMLEEAGLQDPFDGRTADASKLQPLHIAAAAGHVGLVLVCSVTLCFVHSPNAGSLTTSRSGFPGCKWQDSSHACRTLHMTIRAVVNRVMHV